MFPPGQMSRPSPELKSLDRLVGIWKVSGGVQGRIRYEWWQKSGFFLAQRVDLMYGERRIKGIEVLGNLQQPGGPRSQEIRTRFYSFLDGLTLDFVYELAENTLTIWYGEKGSSIQFRGKFSEAGNTMTGVWEWPGGGCEVILTSIEAAAEEDLHEAPGAPLSEEYLAEIEELCRQTTAGPWRSYVEGRDHWAGSDFIMTGKGESRGSDIELLGNTIEDQDFIANARQDIPRLIEEIRRLRLLVP